MPLSMELSVAGDKQLNRRLMRYGDRIMNLRPAWEEIIDQIMKHSREQFDSQGARGGTPWRPLADSTVAAKAREGLDPRILHATLELRRSLEQKGTYGQVREVTKFSMMFGSDVFYGAYHQTGTKKMPRRPVVQLTDADRRDFTKIIERYVVESTRGG